MEIRRTASVALVAASLGAIVVAAPANATDDITENAVGTYTIEFPWGPSTWTAVPCEDNAVECIHITQYGIADTGFKHPAWSGNAYWSVGSWIMNGVDTPNALTCKQDKSKHNLPVNYSWDAATNAGYRSTTDPGICDGSPKTFVSPITLTKVGPPPAA